MVRASAKNVWESFVDFDICDRTVPMQKLYCDRPYFLKSNNLKL